MSGSIFDHSHQHFSRSKNITFWKNSQDHTLVIFQCHAFLKASLETKQVSQERIPLLKRGEERVGGKRKGDKGQRRRERSRKRESQHALYCLVSCSQKRVSIPQTFLITFKSSPSGPLFSGFQPVCQFLRERRSSRLFSDVTRCCILIKLTMRLTYLKFLTLLPR